MANPVLVEVLRGGRVESAHTGAIIVRDADGGVVFSLGDVERPIYPRSAIKALQALPLIESGAADRYGLTNAELALACASHSGEPAHAEAAGLMLAKAGRTVAALECGSHWPMGEAAARALARAGGTPSALHNNCSGKHAGFVCLSCAMGEEPAGYVAADHPAMREVIGAVSAMTGSALAEQAPGTDGCSIPTHAIPLSALALGFARFGSGHGLAPLRAAAARRLREAVAAHPFMVAGTGRFDTRLMQALGARAFVKIGAEGVYCASLPERGLGIALKIDCGAGRAAEVAVARVIEQWLAPDGAAGEALAAMVRPQLTNWNGIAVGSLRPAF
jgi:L-asparaginase II